MNVFTNGLSMSAYRFFKLSLLLPVLVPLLLVVLQVFAQGELPDGGVTAFLVFSLYYGGVPYGILVCGLLWLMRGGEEAGIRKLAWVAPLLMATLQFAYTVARGVLTSQDRFPTSAVEGLYFAALALAFGYAYVLLTFALLWLLRRFGVVAPTQSDSR